MELHNCRSNYSPLSEFDDQLSQWLKFSEGDGYQSNSGDKNKFRVEKITDEASDCRNRVVFPPLMALQRQSSGSSFAESSQSGDYYEPSISMAASDADGFSYLLDGLASKIRGSDGSNLRLSAAEASGGLSCAKSLAQQTEESYQLQLALALRLALEATCADDPNFLDLVLEELSSSQSASSGSAESVSHRFWVNGCLSYFDKVPDGFYLIHGIDPYVWTICADRQEDGRVPSIESLKNVDLINESSLEVVLIDRCSDPRLKELQNRAHNIAFNCIRRKDVVEELAKLVCNSLGGAASTGEQEVFTIWKQHSDALKGCLGLILLPIGRLSVGLCRHRALLFKVLADSIDLPCRIVKGCKYCSRDEATSCLVRFRLDREYVVDLMGKPGCLYEPDCLLNGPSSIRISSPLRYPRSRSVEHTIDYRSLAKQYFSNCQSLNLEFEGASTGTATEESVEVFENYNNTQNVARPCNIVREPIAIDLVSATGQIGNQPYFVDSGQSSNASRLFAGDHFVPSRETRELALDIEELAIPWTDLVLKDRIGGGSFGTVHLAEWHGSEVAVKILLAREFHVERYDEFIREVLIMKRLRHPNIVLFMGAVTQPPNLSIVTEYLARGSLYGLLHKSGGKEILDERCRLAMAYDVAIGMNYLHKRSPPIVHRDLKSPNLLVDRKYTVKICDFGLSRLKFNTFLSSKSAPGTPEWMAPEVLRVEPSNEKSDVYSFGVILWELVTLQKPWINLNPAQVIAAVAVNGQRLEIPRNVNPRVAALIEACWANEPWKRPSFASIMATLWPLVKPPSPELSPSDM